MDKGGESGSAVRRKGEGEPGAGAAWSGRGRAEGGAGGGARGVGFCTPEGERAPGIAVSRGMTYAHGRPDRALRAAVDDTNAFFPRSRL